MKYIVKITSGGMAHMPYFIKIGSGIWKLFGGRGRTHVVS
jgi:hypothetical protein